MTAQYPTNTRKVMLSHLTLVGTAALAGSAANAQIIVTHVNQTVGFAPGDLTSFTSSLPGVNQFQIFTALHQWSTGPYRIFTNSIGFRGVGSMQVRGFKTGNSFFILPSPPIVGAGSANGLTFNGFGNTNLHTARIQSAACVTSSNGPNSSFFCNGALGAFETDLNHNQYMDFKFQDSTTGTTDYGWIEVKLVGVVPPQIAPGRLSTFAIEVTAYAYDASGARIGQGQLPVPEPSPAVALAAFSALTLGAVGVRRLKALQK